MAGRRYSISASEDDTIPILACYDKKEGPFKKTFLKVHSCGGCNTQMLANDFVAPFCPCCASEDVTPVSDDLMEHSKEQVEKMVPIAQCTECDTVIASPKEALASLDDKAIYCPACSAVAKAIVADDDDEEDSDTDEDVVDEDSDNLFNNDEGEGGESEETTSEETSDTEETTTEEPTAETTEETTDNEGGAEEVSGDATEAETPSLNANLVKSMAGKSGTTSVVASPDRNSWYLFVDNVPVATASKENASDNVQSMFGTDKFVTAWEAATSDGVTEDILGDFGFTAITTSVPVDEAVKQTVEAAIEEGRKEYNVTAKDISDRYQRCVGIAAVGINKNIFKEENPVKTALIASLTNLRVRNPKRLVEEAFRDHGQQYLANVAIKASELMEKKDETLDDLAETVSEAKPEEISDDKQVSEKKPSVVKLFPIKEEKETEEEVSEENKDGPIKLAASDNSSSIYDNILAGAADRVSGSRA